VTIDRPIDQVWAFLSDGENDPKFSDRLIEIRRTTPDPPGVGTVYASTARDMGLKAKHEFEITRFDAPHTLRWTERSKGPITVSEGGYDLVEADGGTRLTYFNDLEGHGVGKLLLGLVHGRLAKGSPAFAAKMKQAVEAS
jgi:carbon monoxide dehydrogenase subunit G